MGAHAISCISFKLGHPVIGDSVTLTHDILGDVATLSRSLEDSVTLVLLSCVILLC